MLRKFLLVGATALLMTACASGPDHATLGFQALQKHDYATAETQLKQAMADNPNNPYALLNLGAVYQNTGRGALAVPLYKKVEAVGKDIYPGIQTKDNTVRRSLADIARDNLHAMGAD